MLEKVSHHQWVFSIPKRLRPYFMYDRKLLLKRSKCAWTVLSEYLKEGISKDKAAPSYVIAVQTFGEFLTFNPHLHIMATDGCFCGSNEFGHTLTPKAKELEAAIAAQVFKL